MHRTFLTRCKHDFSTSPPPPRRRLAPRYRLSATFTHRHLISFPARHNISSSVLPSRLRNLSTLSLPLTLSFSPTSIRRSSHLMHTHKHASPPPIQSSASHTRLRSRDHTYTSPWKTIRRTGCRATYGAFPSDHGFREGNRESSRASCSNVRTQSPDDGGRASRSIVAETRRSIAAQGRARRR